MSAQEESHPDNHLAVDHGDAAQQLPEGRRTPNPYMAEEARAYAKLQAGKDQSRASSRTSSRLDPLSDQRRFQEHFAEQQRQFLSQQRAVTVNTALDQHLGAPGSFTRQFEFTTPPNGMGKLDDDSSHQVQGYGPQAAPT